MITGLAYEDRANLKECSKKVNKLNVEVKKIKNQVPDMVKLLNEDSVYSGPFYVQLIDYLREMAHATSFIVEPVFEYIDNNHKAFEQEQIEELNVIQAKLSEFFTHINTIINDRSYLSVNIDSVLEEQESLLKSIKKFRKVQIKRIKAEKVGTRNSVLFLGVLNETKNLILYAGNLLKASRDFATSNEEEDLD